MWQLLLLTVKRSLLNSKKALLASKEKSISAFVEKNKISEKLELLSNSKLEKIFNKQLVFHVKDKKNIGKTYDDVLIKTFLSQKGKGKKR